MLKNTDETFIEKASRCFENEDLIGGAKYLFKAYYESDKSKEILGYFDEIFFKPNLEELERIYNINSEKIRKELNKETLKFKDLPYYVIPITEKNFYLFDKSSNDIISEGFTDEQINIIELCTNENLELKNKLESKKHINELYPKVTIIIPTYNQKKHLMEALDSCLKQDYPNLDILVGDDCSTDGTDKIIKKYLNKDKRIRYVKNNKNLGGEENTRTLFYNFTDSEYGMIFNHDDYFIKDDYISKAIKYFQENPNLSLVWANSKIKYEKTGKFESKNLKNKKIINGIEYFINYETEKYPHITGMLTSVFNFEKLKEVSKWAIKGKTHSIFLDTILYLKLMLVGDIGFVNEEVSVYRSHENSISYNFSRAYDDIVIKEFELMKEYVFDKEFFNENQINIWINNRVYAYVNWRFYTLWISGKKRDAIELLIDIKINYFQVYEKILNNL